MELTIDLDIQEDFGKEFKFTSISFKETIYQLKKRIEELKGYEIEQQMLALIKNNKRISDQTKLCDIQELTSAPKKVLKLKVYYKMISLLILRQSKTESDLKIKTYPCCNVIDLKATIEKHTKISSLDQTLRYNGVTMENDKILADYNLKDPEDFNPEDASTTTISRPFEISLFIRKGERSKLRFGIDFSFNIIKDVKKMGWKESAPWYRELSDGLSWFCYCRNAKCEIADQLFIIHKGFGHFYFEKDIRDIKCPLCSKSFFEVRNIGFVQCLWQYKGVLTNKKDSKISGEGRTYDNKLYTFKETNYKMTWETLELLTRPLDPTKNFQNISKDGSVDEEKDEDVNNPIEHSNTNTVNACKCSTGNNPCVIF